MTGHARSMPLTCVTCSMTAKRGVGTPEEATTRLAMALSSVSASVSGSECV
jgi:hypothetical protein